MYDTLEHIEDIIFSRGRKETAMTSSDNADLDKLFKSIKFVFYDNDDLKFDEAVYEFIRKCFIDVKDYNKIKIEIIRYLINKEINKEIVKFYPKWKWKIENDGINTHLTLALNFDKKSFNRWGDDRFTNYKFFIDNERLTYAFNKLYESQWKPFHKPYHPCFIEYNNGDPIKEIRPTCELKLKCATDDLKNYVFGPEYGISEGKFDYDFSYVNDMVKEYKQFILNYNEIFSNLLKKINYKNT